MYKTTKVVCFILAMLVGTQGMSFADAPPLRQLTVISSSNGLLNATIDATAQKIELGGISFDGLAYNNLPIPMTQPPTRCCV